VNAVGTGWLSRKY